MDDLCRFRPPATGRQLTWEITQFCNLFCDHCCTSSGPDVNRAEEPSLRALLGAASQIADAGVTKVQFSGGEPLLRQGFLEILDEIDTSRVRVHVASNGYSLSPLTIDRLLKSGLHKLSVSVDGGTAAHHDLMRRKNGAFDRTMAGIERATAAGARVGVSVTVTPGNLGSLETLVERLAHIGVADVSVHSVIAVGRAVIHPELIMADETAMAFENTVLRLADEYASLLTIEHNFGTEATGTYEGCPAQDRLLHIAPSGDVSPCSWLYKIDPIAFTLGNIADRQLQVIVDSFCDRLDEVRTAESQRCPIPLATQLARAS